MLNSREKQLILELLTHEEHFLENEFDGDFKQEKLKFVQETIKTVTNSVDLLQSNINTDIGNISIGKSIINKGLWVEVNSEPLVLIEHDTVINKHVIRVWNKNKSEDDYEYIQVIE